MSMCRRFEGAPVMRLIVSVPADVVADVDRLITPRLGIRHPARGCRAEFVRQAIAEKLERDRAYLASSLDDLRAHARTHARGNRAIPSKGASMSNDETNSPEATDTAATPILHQDFNKGLRRFREANPRIDYYPSQRAREAIDSLRQRYPGHPVRDLIDALIREGDKVFRK